MTDNEIIKALDKRMSNGKWIGKGFLDKQDFLLLKNALDLINRQKAEIERLHKQVELGNEHIENLTKAFNDRTAELQTAKLDIKQLHIDVERIDNRRIKDCRFWQSKYSSLRAEAIKKFADRLKEKERPTFPLAMVVDISEIDNLVKEMVGDDYGDK